MDTYLDTKKIPSQIQKKGMNCIISTILERVAIKSLVVGEGAGFLKTFNRHLTLTLKLLLWNFYNK